MDTTLENVQNPFVGLRPFNSNEALFFFGRDDQTIALLERLHRHRFVAVIGSSGCGKSSLILAGLIPKLKAGMLVGDRDSWTVATLKPGDNPWKHMAQALLQAFPEYQAQLDMDRLSERLYESDISAVLDIFGPTLKQADANLLVLVDQFEEIFRYAQIKANGEINEEAIDFVSFMLALTQQEKLPIYVVMTMRSDFIGECDKFYGLPESINRSIYLVPRLTRKQRKEVIEGPIRLFAGSITPGLVNRLLNEAGDEADQLPILQHALMRTWDHWKALGNGPLDIEHYEAVGTIRDALSKDAENALSGMTDDELNLAKQIFQTLTDTDSGNRQIRRPARISVIKAVIDADREQIMRIIERFRTAGRNFLVLSESEKQNDFVVDISHESLIRQWSTLKKWVNEEAEARSMYLRLVDAALLNQKGKAGLWRNPELQLALEWQEKIRPNRPWAERYSKHFDQAKSFLTRSKTAQDKEISRKRNRLIAITLLTVFCLGAIAWVWISNSRQKAKHAHDIELARIEQEKLSEELDRQNRKNKRSRILSQADSDRRAGNRALVERDFTKAIADLEKALAVYELLGEKHKSVEALIDVGKVHVFLKKYGEVRTFYDRALALSRHIGDKNLEGQVLEKLASLYELENNVQEARNYYAEAQSSFQRAGEQQANARVLERLAVFDEDAKEFEKASDKYRQAATGYAIAGDQLGIARVETAIEKIEAIFLPWGYLVDLQTGEIHELRGEEVQIGRSLSDESIKNDISFSNRYISRRHINITRDLKIDDMRSRNGTSINGLLLRYGTGVQLHEYDIITLADIKALLFVKSRPAAPQIPENAWAIMIDNKTRKFTYFTQPLYSLKLMNDRMVPFAGERADARMKIRFKNSEISMFEVKDEWTALYEYKETDYDYKTYIFREGTWFKLLARPLWYAKLTPDRTKIDVEGPAFQIIALKEPKSD
jgi:tetratricopeptide (TPR) repeat protein